MSKFLYKMERKFGKYSTDKLPLIMLICYALGFVLQLINPLITEVLSLNPYAIIHGMQFWRLITWVLIPPGASNLFFLLLVLYFYYSISMSLMHTWGKFYFNLYIFSGLFFTVLAAFVFYGYSMVFCPDVVLLSPSVDTIFGMNYYFVVNSNIFSTYYINMSIFLAFAATYPNSQVLLFFVVPIKVKVLGIIYAILLVYDVLTSGSPIVSGIILVMVMMNFILFFAFARKNLRRPEDVYRKIREAARHKEKMRKEKIKHMQPQNNISKHKCAICGQTADSNPDLEFRFCSKCEGNYEYCQNHLFTHVHVTRDK